MRRFFSRVDSTPLSHSSFSSLFSSFLLIVSLSVSPSPSRHRYGASCIFNSSSFLRPLLLLLFSYSSPPKRFPFSCIPSSCLCSLLLLFFLSSLLPERSFSLLHLSVSFYPSFPRLSYRQSAPFLFYSIFLSPLSSTLPPLFLVISRALPFPFCSIFLSSLSSTPRLRHRLSAPSLPAALQPVNRLETLVRGLDIVMMHGQSLANVRSIWCISLPHFYSR